MDILLKLLDVLKVDGYTVALVLLVAYLVYIIVNGQLLKLEKVDNEQDALLRQHAEELMRLAAAQENNRMTTTGEIKNLQLQLRSVEGKVDDIFDRLDKHIESQDKFQAYVYKRLGD